ncbi:MAG: hypothetical protein CMB64_02900 [Euryarchaeota archaeon]|nr:hypothetical protein [Euryarchaeota archaeon]
MANVAMIVSNRHDPDPRVQKEAEALVNAGHSVQIYAYDRGHEITTQKETINGVEIERIRTNIVPYGKIIRTGLGLRKFRSIVKNKLIEKPVDIIHCHDQDTCSIGLWWKKTGRGKFIFDAHDLYWTWLLLPNPNSIIRKFGSLILKRRDRKFVKNADLLIVATGDMDEKRGFKEVYNTWRTDSVVIMNSENKYSESWTYPNNFTIGYFGNLRDVKMFKSLIKAMKLINEEDRPKLRIAGGGAESKKIAEMFEKNPEIDVKITGRYSHSEIKKLMDECSIQYCLYSSKRGNIEHTIPAKLFSSIACGKKAIVNSNSLASKICNDLNWGWEVNDEDIKGIANIILDLNTKWKNHSKKNVKDKYPFGAFENKIDWDSQAIKLIEAYDALNMA